MNNVQDTVSTFAHLRRMFLSTDIPLEQWIAWFVMASFISDPNTKLRVFNKIVPGLASPRRTTCLLYGGGPRLGICFENDSW